MTARQTRQHFRTGIPAGSSRIAEDDDAIAFGYGKLLQYLAGARDPSMLEQKRPAVMQLELAAVNLAMGDDTSSTDTFISVIQDTPFLELCMRAVANSMNVMLQDSKGSVLDRRKALDVVSSLCYVIAVYIRHRIFEDIRENVHAELNASGLMPALSHFTEAAWQALQQVNVSDCQQQCVQSKAATRSQQRQQQMRRNTLVERCRTAAEVIQKLFVLWHAIWGREKADACVENSPVIPATEDTLPALIALTTTAVSLLRKARAYVAGSSSSNTKVAAYDCLVKSIAARGQVVARMVAFMDGPWKTATKQEQQQQMQLQLQRGQQQHYILTEKLPELLLQLLARQAGQLHAACGGMSVALQDRRAAATATPPQELQQYQQQPQRQQHHEFLGGFVVPSGHQALLELLGVASEDLNPAEDVSRSICLYGVTCNVLGSMVRARFWAATLVSKWQQDADRQQQKQQEQQQQQQSVVDDRLIVLPWHLLVPAIKVLIEVVLLLPAKVLMVHTYSINLILLLLHTSASPVAAAAAAGGAAVVEENGPATAAFPWLRLPAAVAAGLLQPVVCQLSQAVMYCLLETDEVQSEDDEMKAERLLLLHSYGSLLITVCQSVEFKHVATALKSQSAPDLLITLAAVEAVIRAQACHLAPEQWKQQQQQQQEHQPPADNGSSISSFDVLTDITQHPLSEAPVFLLSFVTEIALALEGVINEQCGHLEALLTGVCSPVANRLSIRLVTLLSTVNKVSRCAIARAAVVEAGTAATGAARPVKEAPATSSAVPAQLECVCRLTMANAVTSTRIAYRWSDHTIISMMDRCAVRKVLAMSVVLVSSALQDWTRAWLSLAETYDIAATSTPQGVGFTKSINPLAPVMRTMTAAFGNAQSVLEGLAAQVEELAARSAGAGPLDQQQQIHDASCDLHMLVQRARQVEACLQATLQIAITEAGTGSPSEATAESLAIQSYAELSDILDGIEVVYPSTALLISMNHSAAMLSELAATVLSCFPPPIICNNPMCMNLNKLSEWQLVSGNACVCAGCELARYCSRSCQIQNWKLHKPTCCG